MFHRVRVTIATISPSPLCNALLEAEKVFGGACLWSPCVVPGIRPLFHLVDLLKDNVAKSAQLSARRRTTICLRETR